MEMNLKIEKIDQIGIIVKDLESTMKLLEIFGIGPFQIFDRGVDDFFYKEKWNKIHIRNALCRLNNIQVELIEVVDVIDGACCQKDFLNENGPGIHHFATYVDDLNPILQNMKEKGIKVLQKGATKGLMNWVYLDTEDQLGFVIELIELKKRKKRKKRKK